MILPTSQELHTGSGGATAPDERSTPASQEPHTLQGLLERLRATGPNRELDGEIWTSLLWTRNNTDPIFWELLAAGKWRDALSSVQYDWQTKDWVPRYTASLDAALALVERVLPEWHWSVRKMPLFPGPEGFLATVFKIASTPFVGSAYDDMEQGRAPTAPLALLIALLTALSGDPLVTTIPTKSTV